MQTRDCAMLRRAAGEHDWYECEVALKRLFTIPDAQQVMHLAIQQVAMNLPTFQHYNPTVVWPQEFLAVAAQLRPIDHSQYAFALYSDEKYRGYASEYFIHALRYLNGALDHLSQPTIYGNLAASAVALAIYGSSLEAWTSAHPDDAKQWALVVEDPAQFSNEQVEELQRRIALFTHHGQALEDSWLAIADRLKPDPNLS